MGVAGDVNFAYPFLSKEHYASTWPADARNRLERLRAQYDPAGLFTFARGYLA